MLFDETELPTLTSSAAGSRVRTYRALADALALKVRDLAFGRNTGALLANFDPASSSWRTCQACLVSGWEPFLETWPRSGSMRNGIAYQQQPLAALTYGTGFGSSPTHSIPTPTASDHIERRETFGQLNFETNKAVTLDRFVRMWPTPTASDSKSGSMTDEARARRAEESSRGEKLANTIGGALNPTWVEWLMGFPLGWTALEPSVTPSSLKSPNSSAAQS
jgi:hypothetical protein